jgi:hypothetical protein
MDEDFRKLKTSEKCDDGAESCSTTGVPKIVSNCVSIVGLNAWFLKRSTWKVIPLSRL